LDEAMLDDYENALHKEARGMAGSFTLLGILDIRRGHEQTLKQLDGLRATTCLESMRCRNESRGEAYRQIEITVLAEAIRREGTGR